MFNEHGVSPRTEAIVSRFKKITEEDIAVAKKLSNELKIKFPEVYRGI